MNESNVKQFKKPEANPSRTVLEEILANGAQQMLQRAVENEVMEFLEKHKSLRDEKGHLLAVRNGYSPERDIITGMGKIKVKQPRIDDRKLEDMTDKERFISKILPRYLRRTASINNLIPALYLKGISTGSFPDALSAILGDGVKGLSSANIVRLKSGWEEEYEEWSKRDLSGKKYVYFWADGVYFNVRLEDDNTCILVIMAADEAGNKELLAVNDGFRESKISWKDMLMDLKKRGIDTGPQLAIGDGGLGFWSALREVFPGTKEQRCWVHKTANILDKLPKRIQSQAKRSIHEMYMADTKKDALSAYDDFIKLYEDKYPKAVDCLTKDKDRLFTFYDFPGVHWIHIRTTNPIESTFATVRLRTKKTKGCGSRLATLTMVFQLAREAQKTWHKLKGYKLIPLVLSGRTFVDGRLQEAA